VIASAQTSTGAELSEFRAAKMRLLENVHAAPFSTQVEATLARLPPLLVLEIRPALRQVARGRHLPAPASWAETTRRVTLRSAADVVAACADAGVEVNCVADLASRAAMDAVAQRILAGRWSPINAGRVLRHVRTLHRAVHGSCPDRLRLAAAKYSRAAPRFIWHRLQPTSRYVAAAHALWAIAGLYTAAERTRGYTLRRDALLFACAAEATLRLGEIAILRIRMLELNHVAGRPCVELHIPGRHSKVRFGRIARIFDARTIRLLEPLLNKDPDAALFPSIDGKALARAGIAASLSRTGYITVGAASCANLFRRAGASDAPPDREERRKRLGHAPGSRIAESVYMRHSPEIGHQLVRQAVYQATRAHGRQLPSSDRGRLDEV
jgi:hypothetical protein